VDVRAIILVGVETEAISCGSTATYDSSVPEESVGAPIAALDLVGQPVVCHVIDRLRNYGVSDISVLNTVAPQSGASLVTRLPANVHYAEISASAIWTLAEGLFLRMAKEKADAVLILRIGPYAEVDFNQLLNLHFSRRNCATSMTNQFRQSLDIVALDAARADEAAVVIRRRMQWNWRPSEMVVTYGYFNALRNGRDFRTLAEDVLMRRCAVIPRAREVTPGVWLGKNARLHNSVKVEAPVFIGERATLREDVVVRGCACIEAHSEIDKGTLIDGSTVLPRTYVGKQLTLARSVAGFSQIAQVDRNVTVHVADQRLTKTISAAPLRNSLEPVRSGLFLVKRAVSASLARMYSRGEPMKTSDVKEELPVKTIRAQAAAASASRSSKRREDDLK
jgi:NDP-sugar pyrophosphorylase family protein